MVNRNLTKNLSYKLESLSDSQINSLLKFIEQNENSIKTKETGENEDELITSLAKRPENKRARQVFEWETTRRSSSRPRFSVAEKYAA